eukprot:359517-Chlamydomonas_euryale.AAC.33
MAGLLAANVAGLVTPGTVDDAACCCRGKGGDAPTLQTPCGCCSRPPSTPKCFVAGGDLWHSS